MANGTDDKGPPPAGEGAGSKRPYATLDLKATEVGSGGKPEPSGAGGAAKPGAGPAPGSTGKPPPSDWRSGYAGVAAAANRIGERVRGAGSLASHAAAGAAGAILVLLAYLLFAVGPTVDTAPASLDLTRRLADIENVVGTRPGASGLRGRVEELSRSVGAVGDQQAKLAEDARALEARLVAPQDLPADLVNRLTRLEETLATLPSSQGAEPSAAAKAVLARLQSEIAAARIDAGRLGQRVSDIKTELDERLKGSAKAADLAALGERIAALERGQKSFLQGETERNDNAARIVLSLELANLKRALDRGDAYAGELAAVRKVSGTRLDLAALERYAGEGVPAQAEIAKSFRKTANAMLDAEAEPADASLVERLLSGARSIVRIRKAGHSADDTSLEAVIGRMERALKEGRLAEVRAEGKKLPPKAALAGEDWLRKVEARETVDRALADIESALKASLRGAGVPATDAQR